MIKRCIGKNLPLMRDEEGRLRRFKMLAFEVARERYIADPTPANKEAYFLEVLPLISFKFTDLWNRHNLIEKDRGYDPNEVFIEVCARCAAFIQPGKVESWHGSYSWQEYTKWMFWNVHAINERKVKADMRNVSLDALDGAECLEQRPAKKADVNIYEEVIELFLGGKYQWRVCPEFCQYLAVQKLGGNYDGKEVQQKAHDERYHSNYLLRNGISNLNLIDFLHRHVNVCIRMELHKRGRL